MRISVLYLPATAICVVLVLFFLPDLSRALPVVYDNTQNSLGGVAVKGLNVEFGNTITLDGPPPPNARVVTDLAINLSLQPQGPT